MSLWEAFKRAKARNKKLTATAFLEIVQKLPGRGRPIKGNADGYAEDYSEGFEEGIPTFDEVSARALGETRGLGRRRKRIGSHSVKTSDSDAFVSALKPRVGPYALSDDGVLQRGTMTFWVGGPGSLKTTLALELLKTGSFFGSHQFQSGLSALFIEADIDRRGIDFLCGRLGNQPNTFHVKTAFYYPQDKFKETKKLDDTYLTTEKGWSNFEKHYTEIKPDIIILDALLFLVKNKRSEEQTKELVANIKLFAANSFIVILAHPTKDGKTYAGGYEWGAAIDNMFFITATQKDSNPRQSTIHCDKKRNELSEAWEKDIIVTSKMDGAGDKKRYRITYSEEPAIDLKTKVGQKEYAIKKYREGKKKFYICKEMGISRTTLDNWIKEERAEGGTISALKVEKHSTPDSLQIANSEIIKLAMRSLLQKAVRRGYEDVVTRTSNYLHKNGDSSWLRSRSVIIAFEECWPLAASISLDRDFASKQKALLDVATAIKQKDAAGLGALADAYYQSKQVLKEDKSIFKFVPDKSIFNTLVDGLNDPAEFFQSLHKSSKSDNSIAIIKVAEQFYPLAHKSWDKAIIMAGALLSTVTDIPPVRKAENPEGDFEYWAGIDKHTPQGADALRDVAKTLNINITQLKWVSFYFESARCNEMEKSPWFEAEMKWKLCQQQLSFEAAEEIWLKARDLVSERLAKVAVILQMKLSKIEKVVKEESVKIPGPEMDHRAADAARPTESENPKNKGNMYQNIKAWNVGTGCYFECVYCYPTFRRQINRQKKRCAACGTYEFHLHKDRINEMPSVPKDVFIWPFQASDLFWARKPSEIEFIRKVIAKTAEHPERTFFWQSKAPVCFQKFINDFPSNTILGTTLESNRDDIYEHPVVWNKNKDTKISFEKISEAPFMSERVKQFLKLKWPRKTVTLEPILKFDHKDLLDMIISIRPEKVWIGLNSKPKDITGLPEPTRAEIDKLIADLGANGISVERKKTIEDPAEIEGRVPEGEKAIGKKAGFFRDYPFFGETVMDAVNLADDFRFRPGRDT